MNVRVPEKPCPGALFLPSRELELRLPSGSLCLLLGGAKSGKSRFAEAAAEELAKTSAAPLYYLATMIAGEDPENQLRICRHRRQRAGKGYSSLEFPRLRELEEEIPEQAILLLDCLGNLLANELFSEEEFPRTERAAALLKPTERGERILNFLSRLSARSRALFIVSNDVGGEAAADPLSRLWILEMARLHAALGEIGFVIEIAAGCPLLLSQERKSR